MRRIVSRFAVGSGVLLTVLVAGYYGATSLGLGSAKAERPLSAVARRSTLKVIVTERGSLESTVTVDGICELTGMQNKIIQLVPEGTKVKKGDVVVKFDTSEIEKNIAQQEIKSKQAKARIETTLQEVEIARSKGEGEEADAKIELLLAKGNLEKYQKADFKSEIADLKGMMAQQESKAEEARVKLDQTKELVKKGFRSQDQLRSARTEYEQYDYFLKRDQEKFKSKTDFEYQLKSLEYSSKIEQAEGKVKRSKASKEATISKAVSESDAAKATFTVEDALLQEYLKQRSLAVIRAEQEGVVAYSNERWYDPSSQVREGASVYSRQKIFSLPDMTKMQVKVNIHESLVKKVKAGQTAEIRVDAFPNAVLVGRVKSVSQLADSNQSFMRGGSKEYTTLVTIEKMPEEGLKPGMTAEVQILVSNMSNLLLVPLQAVVERKGEHFVYVEEKPGTIIRKPVKIGESNDRNVEIVEGIREGDRVTLDARTRSEIEFKGEADKDADDKSSTPPASPGASSAPVTQ